MKIFPTIEASIEKSAISKELSVVFFVKVAKSAEGIGTPIELKIPEIVFGQKLGVTTHPGIIRVVRSVKK